MFQIPHYVSRLTALFFSLSPILATNRQTHSGVYRVASHLKISKYLAQFMQKITQYLALEFKKYLNIQLSSCKKANSSLLTSIAVLSLTFPLARICHLGKLFFRIFIHCLSCITWEYAWTG